MRISLRGNAGAPDVGDRRFLQLIRRHVAVLFLLLCIGSPAPAEESENSPPPSPLATQFRRPVALAFVDNGNRLLVANRRSGTISTIDTAANTLVNESPIGGLLSDLVVHPRDARCLLAADEQNHVLLLLSRRGDQIGVDARIEVPASPVSVRVSDDGQHAFVASLWSRRLTVVRIEATGNAGAGVPQLEIAKSISLPFAPRLQIWLESARRLVVADAFGGNLALVDPAAGVVESVRSLPWHNIRGLALDVAGERLLVSHQTLSALARTTFEDVHWGTLMTNVAHSLALAAVVDRHSDLLRDSRALRQGEVSNGAADPAAIATTGDGRIVVAFSGVDQIAVLREGRPGRQRIPVGKRPTAVVAHPARPLRIYVANTFDDTLSVVDAVEDGGWDDVAAIALGPQPEPSLVDRGEMLFYDARLSHDRWMSCHSCHSDGHTNGLLNDNQGDGSFDSPKRVLSLLGVGDTAPWAWNGSVDDLETQVRKSVQTTMHGPADAADLTADQASALAAFLRSLPPAPAIEPAGRANRAAFERGLALFNSIGCNRCHAPPAYTASTAFDVGLVDEVGNTRFNPPSLRGVGQRDRLFHDSRARSLEEVVTKYRHEISGEISRQELQDLLLFLRSL